MPPPFPASVSSLHAARFLARALQAQATLRPRTKPPPWAPLHPRPQCRCVHLYKSAKMKVQLGLHVLLPFSPYRAPPLETSEHRVNLWSKPGGELIAPDVPLPQLLRHVEPGRFLCPVATIPRKVIGDHPTVDRLQEKNVAHDFNNYYIADFIPQKTIVKKTKSLDPLVKQMSKLMEIHIDLASPADYMKISLDRLMSGLQQGRPVEVCLRVTGKHIKDKLKRLEAGDLTVWPWVHERLPHLHPDIIVAAMPKGTHFCIKPWSNGAHVQFVLALVAPKGEKRSLDNKLMQAKAAVQAAIKGGNQSQLPKVLRRKFIEEGHAGYTLDDGVPLNARGEGLGGSTWMTYRPGTESKRTKMRREGREHDERKHDERKHDERKHDESERPHRWMGRGQSRPPFPGQDADRRRARDTIRLD
ncbi:hypothetical protein K491DRAFT_19824 [Lophiostoma macrostomum CBS 122681]|uniref:Uncharacterized protein n=1 Tax=Lophiostoma macrostomum CBS 122681 TaxID=1314788 RepID=A0A6A6TLG6_9PLEO|nr:hypothetical protein K491DRAFT_19824 [Lophiostoma macrostomum CBS 122681]